MTLSDATPASDPPDAAATTRAGLSHEVVTQLRRYVAESDRLSQVFCDVHGIHRTDLHALAHLRDATREGRTVGAGQLAEHLGLSTSATTAVIDRLERQGHVQRVREGTDRRRITVRFGRADDGVARTFFLPMAARADEVMAGFDDDELQVVARFLEAITEAVTEETLAAARAGRRSLTPPPLTPPSG